MNALRYRYATSDDAPLLARLNAQLVAEGADFGPADPGYLEQRMRRWLSSGRDHAVLFEDSRGRLLAYALYEEQAQEIYLRQFLVLDAARRNGVGRQAFRLLRSEIWSARKRLTLEVLSSNQAGYRFWRSLGYRNCAVTLEIPAPAAQPAGFGRAAALGGAPLRLLRAIRGLVAGAVHALARSGTLVAFLGFISMPVAAAAPLNDADPISAAQLQALRASGGYCPASVYRTAWSVARTYQIEPAWVIALIEAESSYRADAVSRAGALGLMQLLPDSGAREAYRLAYGGGAGPSAALLRDPQANVRMGVAYLRALHRHFDSINSTPARLLLAVAAYNCGTGPIDQDLPAESSGWDADEAGRWIAAHAPRETRSYVRRVRSRALRYTLAIGAATASPAAALTADLAP
ncbi:MAG TPA: GNAT family N-acetyltransferase [Nevskia sp.]|nr:GNAT family N-acetyltransferase [Nevskia sp.]